MKERIATHFQAFNQRKATQYNAMQRKAKQHNAAHRKEKQSKALQSATQRDTMQSEGQ